MTLLEIQQVLVEQSGLRDLVVDAENGDYSASTTVLANATYVVNSGMRWLERRWAGDKNLLRFRANLAEGGTTIDLPYVQYIKRLDISDGETITHPRFLSYDAMRARYPEPYADIDGARPGAWTWNPRPHPTLNNPIVNGSFATSLAGWFRPADDTSAGSVTATGGAAAFTYPASAPGPSLAQTLATSYPTDTDVTFTIGSLPSGSIIFVMAAYDYSNDTYTVVTTSTKSSTGTYTVTSTGTFDTIAFVYSSATTAHIATITNVEMDVTDDEPAVATYSRQILLLAPSDADYTVEIWGSFANVPLVEEASYNYWTIEHPDLVVRASRIQLELDGFRNVSGFEAFHQQTENELARIHAQDRFAYIAGLSTKEACRRG